MPECSSCLHWQRLDEDSGQCHHQSPRPPVFLLYGSAPEAPAKPVWPVTLAVDGCGQFQPMPVRPDESAEALRERLARAQRNSLSCCFCNASCESLAALRQHSTECQEHPAAKEVVRLKAIVEGLTQWCASQSKLLAKKAEAPG